MTNSSTRSNAIIIGPTRPAAVQLATTNRRPAFPTVRDHARTPPPITHRRDFFPTPPEATRALLSVESFDGPVWEPACGEGAIASELIAAGHRVVSTDLYAYGFGLAGINFLRETTPRARHVITNPPYGKGLADAFLLHALAMTRITRGKVALLLNLASLAHPRRTPLWRAQPPSCLYAIDGVTCWPEHRYGPMPDHFSRHRYVWAVWDRGGGTSTTTTFGWLSAHDFR